MPEKTLYRCDCGYEGTFWFRKNGKVCCVRCDHPLTWSREVNAQGFEPVVVFEDASGNFRFPTSADAPIPSGFAKRELTTVQEVRKFESRVNAQQRAEWDRNKSNEERAFDAQRRERHGELRQAMQHMSAFGADFARVAMEKSNAKTRGSYDAGFRVEVFSDNQGNRESYRDERTGWRGRRA